MKKRITPGLIATLLALAAAPVPAALPACINSCQCGCGFGCITNHTCLFRSRTVDHAPLPGQNNRYRIICYYRGGMRTDSQGTYFCCGHSFAVHGHDNYALNQ